MQLRRHDWWLVLARSASAHPTHAISILHPLLSPLWLALSRSVARRGGCRWLRSAQRWRARCIAERSEDARRRRRGAKTPAAAPAEARRAFVGVSSWRCSHSPTLDLADAKTTLRYGRSFAAVYIAFVDFTCSADTREIFGRRTTFLARFSRNAGSSERLSVHGWQRARLIYPFPYSDLGCEMELQLLEPVVRFFCFFTKCMMFEEVKNRGNVFRLRFRAYLVFKVFSYSTAFSS